MRPTQTRRRRESTPRAFTIIELLVSMTVLVILVGLIAQMVSSATSVTMGNRARLDADGQARAVFDRMAFDFGKMLKRPDVDYIFAKIDGANGGANDKMFFYSEAPAFFDNPSAPTTTRSSVALVGYRINPLFQLERLGKQLTWDGAPSNSAPGSSNSAPGGIMYLSPPAASTTGSTTNFGPDPLSTLAGNWPPTLGSATDMPPYSPPGAPDQDYHVLASQVCRLEFCFQLTNGLYSAVPISPLKAASTTTPAPTNNLTATTAPTSSDFSGYSAGSKWYDKTAGRAYVCTSITLVNNTPTSATWTFLGMQDVRAIVAALAILDGTSTRTLPTYTLSTAYNGQTQTPDLSKLIPLFQDALITDATTGTSSHPGFTYPDNMYPNITATPAPAQAGGAPRLMAESWTNALAAQMDPSLTPQSVLPRRTLAQVRVYQRTFVLNNQ